MPPSTSLLPHHHDGYQPPHGAIAVTRLSRRFSKLFLLFLSLKIIFIFYNSMIAPPGPPPSKSTTTCRPLVSIFYCFFLLMLIFYFTATIAPPPPNHTTCRLWQTPYAKYQKNFPKMLETGFWNDMAWCSSWDEPAEMLQCGMDEWWCFYVKQQRMDEESSASVLHIFYLIITCDMWRQWPTGRRWQTMGGDCGDLWVFIFFDMDFSVEFWIQ